MILVPLGQLGDFKNGINFKSELMGRGVCMVNVKDITSSHRISPSGLDMVDVQLSEDLIATTDDIFFVRSSVKLDGIGLAGKITSNDPTATHCGFVIRFRPTSPKVNSDYLAYLLLSPEYRQRLKGLSAGAAIVNLSQANLKGLPIPLPAIDVQQRIANTLSTYDDLIENNRRRMFLLEEAARQLYCEWFVRLRFPGHEHTHIIKGGPDGWEQLPASDAVNINPATPLSDEEEHWFVEMAALSTNGLLIQYASKRDGRSGSRFRNGDTLFARITPCLENGKTAFVDFLDENEVGRGSTEFIVLRSKRLTPEYVYCLARSYDFRENAIKSMVGTSGRQRVQESCFEKYMVAIPPRALLEGFTEIVRPMFRHVKTLHSENQRLRMARDLLLPRLMKGEIAI